jgi:hypothetical protein
MSRIYRQARCDGCNRILEDKNTVVALVPNVTVSKSQSKRFNGLIRLKLSDDSLDARSIKIYCQNCLELQSYLGNDKDRKK